MCQHSIVIVIENDDGKSVVIDKRPLAATLDAVFHLRFDVTRNVGGVSAVRQSVDKRRA